MANSDQLSPRARPLVGLLFLAIGLFIMLVGTGIIEADPKSVHAPPWVITLAGLCFALIGAILLLGVAMPTLDANGNLPEHAPWRWRFLQYLFGLAIFAAMAMVDSWVALGPGERNFTSSISSLGSGRESAANEISGRIAFGLGAALMWICVIAFGVIGAKKLFARKP